MRKPHLVREVDPIAGTRAARRGAPFADAVQRQDGGLLEWAREERTGGVALMVLEEHASRSRGFREGLVESIRG